MRISDWISSSMSRRLFGQMERDVYHHDRIGIIISRRSSHTGRTKQNHIQMVNQLDRVREK